MPAYLIANIEITDPAGFEEYRKGVAPTLAAHGARYLARGGSTEVLEGTWVPTRLVIIEFPSMVALKSWYDSPIYRPLIELRNRTARSSVVAIEGAAPAT
ncbi:MAG TPA: DUF1330 domain-containing protein [Casimicrobiaceae bacterium]|jgi:uncharacterized protein (DUF1330 family)|nr:DUF1330 domain-containing protein [Casimicrobiaceae bacterium]